MTAVNERTPNIPRFETVKVDAVSSSGVELPACARSTRSRVSGAMRGEGLGVCVEHRRDEQRVVGRDGDADVHAAVALGRPSTNELLNADALAAPARPP